MTKHKVASDQQPKKNDRWGTLNSFVDEMMAELNSETGSPSASLVWFTLFRLCNARDGSVYATTSHIAHLTGIDWKTADKALKALLAKELITKKKEGKQGSHAAAVYQVRHCEHEERDS